MNKTVFYISASIFGTAGSFLGSLLDNGNFFGIWGIFGGLLGGIVGIYLVYKFQQ